MKMSNVREQFCAATGYPYVIRTCQREMHFRNCESIVNMREEEPEPLFKRWFGMKRSTYFRILKYFEISLAHELTVEELDAAEKDDPEKFKWIMAIFCVKKIILTPGDHARDLYTPERCLQFLLTYYSGKIPSEGLEDVGFKSPRTLLHNMAFILRSLLVKYWPIGVSKID